jgi:hypothetical protein
MGKGQLLFKGEKKKKQKSKHSRNKTEEVALVLASSSSPSSDAAAAAVAPAAAASGKNNTTEASSSSSSQVPQIRKGTGKITVSGTVVTGHDTCFDKQVSAGDALLVQLAGEGGGKQPPIQEMRVITMCLSNQSLNLSSGFSQNLKYPTEFSFIRKPRNLQKERQQLQKKQAETERQEEEHAFGTYATNEALVYREKTETGSYRIKKVQLDDGAKQTTSRGDLLYLRAKKTSDKYC